MKFLVWLRNVTVARHLFIFIALTILILSVFTYVIFFGEKNYTFTSAIFNSIIVLYVVHIIWILYSAIYHILTNEPKLGIKKIILAILFVFALFLLNNFFNDIFKIAK